MPTGTLLRRPSRTGIALVIGVVLLVIGIGLVGYRLSSTGLPTPATPGPLFNWTARYASGPVLLSADLTQIMSARSNTVETSACQILVGDLSRTSTAPPPPDHILASEYQHARVMMDHLTTVCLHQGSLPGGQIHSLAHSAQHQLGLVLKVLANLPTQR
ncbi:MAG: hypothetical protein ACP5PJ_07795 [Acidimicrobiales bacterium]